MPVEDNKLSSGDIIRIAEKVKQNEKEAKDFSERFRKYTNGELKESDILLLGETPYSLQVSGAKALPLNVTQLTLKNAMNPEDVIMKHHTSGHELDKEIIERLPELLREPVLIIKDKGNNNLTVVLDVKDKHERNIICIVTLDKKESQYTVNRLSSLYGKRELFEYLSKAFLESRVVSMHKEKAGTLLHSIGCQSPKENTITSFDNSIAYSLANVKYPEITNPNKYMERKNNMPIKEENNLNEIKGLYSVEQNDEIRYYETSESINDILAAAASDRAFVELSTHGRRISEAEYAELQQSAKFGFSVDVDLNENSASVCMVNNGKGGIPDQNRTAENTEYKRINISEFNRQQPEQTKFHEAVKHDKLLPFLNAKAEFHEMRLDNLSHKRATKLDKIAKNEAKISKLTERAERYEDINKALALFANVPAVRAVIERNEQKISNIRNQKIPSREAKINMHRHYIALIDHKSAIIGHKLERAVALSDTVKSFAIIGMARRQKFADAMDRLNSSTIACLTDKKNDLELRIDKNSSLFNSSLTTAVDKLNIQKDISSMQAKVGEIESKIARLSAKTNISRKTDAEIDSNMKVTADILNRSVDSGEMSVTKLSEKLCLSDEAETLDRSKENYLANAEMAVESNYNSIDGVINNLPDNSERIAMTEHEIQNGDQFWDDVTSYYLTPDKTIIAEMKDGYTGEKTYTAISAEELNKQLDNARADNDTKIVQGLSEESKMLLFGDKPTTEMEATAAVNWLDKLMKEGKAEIHNNGSLQVNKEYYYSLNKASRHIEVFNQDKANSIMESLTNQGVEFSAVTRSNGKIAITVSNADKDTLNVSAADRAPTVDKSETNKSRMINADYYKSIPAANRVISTVSEKNAASIMQRMEQNNIPYSAVQNNYGCKITVSKEYEKPFRTAKEQIEKRLINPEFYKSLDKNDRFTQRMNEEQAKEITAELDSKGIQHSAVLNGSKSAVTISQNDVKKAKDVRGFIKKQAQKIHKQKPQQQDDKAKKKGVERD